MREKCFLIYLRTHIQPSNTIRLNSTVISVLIKIPQKCEPCSTRYPNGSGRKATVYGRKQKYSCYSYVLSNLYYSWDLTTRGTANTHYLSQPQAGPHKIYFEFAEQQKQNLNLVLMSLIPRSIQVDGKKLVTWK